jgi:DNA polymerase-3 subunit delta'
MSLNLHFPGLWGQDRIKRQLQAEAAGNRLAHAYLLTGAKGSGRFRLALNLFMALNCQRREEGLSPCLQCPSCQRAGKLQHENLLILAPSQEQASAQIKVDALRQALRTLAFPPLNQGARFILIREAEQLNPAGANALLKSLEEPPPGNFIILCAQDTAALLPTLVSRCRRLNLQPLASEVMFKILREKGLSRIPARIALSGGSLGQALAMDPEQLEENLRHVLRQLFKAGNLNELWTLAEEISGNFRTAERLDRQGLVSFLDLLAQYYRDLAVARAGRPEMALLGQAEEVYDISLARALENFNWVRCCQNQILANAQPELALTVLMNRLL